MKLEFKHYKNYLHYNLKLQVIDTKTIFELKEYFVINGEIRISGYGISIPALRPMSDLTKEIEVNGKRFVPNERIKCYNPNFYYFKRNNCIRENTEMCVIEYEFGAYPYWLIELLSEWHIDFQNLIGQGLAVDINTLSVE